MSEGVVTSSEAKRPSGEDEAADDRRPYEPPEVREIGTVHDPAFTDAGAALKPPGTSDGGGMSAAIASCRHLKEGVRPVEPAEIVATLAGLEIFPRDLPGVQHR